MFLIVGFECLRPVKLVLVSSDVFGLESAWYVVDTNTIAHGRLSQVINVYYSSHGINSTHVIHNSECFIISRLRTHVVLPPAQIHTVTKVINAVDPSKNIPSSRRVEAPDFASGASALAVGTVGSCDESVFSGLTTPFPRSATSKVDFTIMLSYENGPGPQKVSLACDGSAEVMNV
jgi:hypothetical protein